MRLPAPARLDVAPFISASAPLPEIVPPLQVSVPASSVSVAPAPNPSVPDWTLIAPATDEFALTFAVPPETVSAGEFTALLKFAVPPLTVTELGVSAVVLALKFAVPLDTASTPDSVT